MGEIRVRCIGIPVEVSGREDPTEIDLIQPCGWEGAAQIPVGERLDDHCPMCDGVVERVDPKVAGTATHADPRDFRHQRVDPKVEQLSPGVWEQVEGALPHLGPGALSPEAQQQVESILADPKVEQTIQAVAKVTHESERPVICGDAICTCVEAARLAVEAAAPILLERLAEVERQNTALRCAATMLTDQLAEVEQAAREFLEALHYTTVIPGDEVYRHHYDTAHNRLRQMLDEVERDGGT
jgi:hypothetical protein